MEPLSISKACSYPLTHCYTCLAAKPPASCSYNASNVNQSSASLSFWGCLKHQSEAARRKVKLSAFGSDEASRKRQSFLQVVKAGDGDVQPQSELLQQEAESKTENVPEPPSAAEAKAEGVKVGNFWLLRSATEDGKSQEIISGDGILVGAAPNAEGSSVAFVVDYPKVSSVHARVYSRERPTQRSTVCEYFVMDLGSTNGTYVNRSKLRPQTEVKLSPGDTLKFGDEKAVFLVEPQS